MRGFIAASCVLFAFASVAFGWGRDGHAVISEIAHRELSPEVRERVTEILGGKHMAEVGSWADEVRRDPLYRWSAPLHYSNIPPGEPAFVFERHSPPEGCAVSAIKRFSAELVDPALTDVQRREALKFLIHFVGDIHQPLHAGFAHDRGGNDIAVELLGRPFNLHAVWDSGLMRAAEVGPWPAYADRLHSRITDHQRGAWSDLDPEVWTTESYQLAVTFAYAIPENGKLDEDYVQRNIPIVDARLSIAGVRLALLLNELLGGEGEDLDASVDDDALVPEGLSVGG